jgi:hypothetical protein
VIFLVDDRAYNKFKKQSRMISASWNEGFLLTEADKIAMQRPGGIDVSAFYVMHYMHGIN